MKNNTCLLEPYLLGCLLGDGGLHGNLSFASKDQDIIFMLNKSLSIYNYYLKKRSTDPKRSSEYTISPLVNNKIKYKFFYQENEYTGKELLQILQQQNYNITSLDTLKSIAGCSTKTKKSNILKYYPDMPKITYSCLKNTQDSLFINILTKYNLRVRFDKKRIPAEYLIADFSTRLAVFQGLMDTDGCGSEHRLEFCVANKELAEDFIQLAVSLGYNYKLSIRHPKYFNKKYNEYRFGKIAYRINLNNTDIIPFRCQRKLDAYYKKNL